MKRNKAALGLLVTSAVLSGIAVIVLCSILVTDYFNRNNPPVDVSKESVTTKYTGDYWQSKLAELENEQAKTSTPKKTTTTLTTTTAATTAKKTTTTTKKITSKTTDTTFKTTKATTTKTTAAIKTTRLATAAEKEAIYRSAYDEVMGVYEDYKAEMLAIISEIDADISQLEAQKQALDEKYDKEEAALYERLKKEFFAIGIYLSRLTEDYRNEVAQVDREINNLKTTKESIQAELDESEEELDDIIQAAYRAKLEEYQKQLQSY